MGEILFFNGPPKSLGIEITEVQFFVWQYAGFWLSAIHEKSGKRLELLPFSNHEGLGHKVQGPGNRHVARRGKVWHVRYENLRSLMVNCLIRDEHLWSFVVSLLRETGELIQCFYKGMLMPPNQIYVLSFINKHRGRLQYLKHWWIALENFSTPLSTLLNSEHSSRLWCGHMRPHVFMPSRNANQWVQSQTCCTVETVWLKFSPLIFICKYECFQK